MLTKNQDNRYKAYGNLHQALTLDPTPYQKDKAMQGIVARLGTNVQGITDNLVPGARKTKGLTQDKSAAKAALTTAAAELAGDLYAYASNIENATLQAEADYSRGDLDSMSGTRLTTVVGLLRQRLTDHATPLADYDVNATRLKEFDDALLASNTQRNNPRQQIGANAATRLTTGTHFRTLVTIVKDELQRALRKYERLAPTFYARVRSAREVIDQPATHQPATAPPQP